MREILYKTLFVLSIISVFAIALYSSSGPITPFVANTPTFVNPFSLSTENILVLPGSSTRISQYPQSWTGCIFYWDCLRDIGKNYYVANNSYINYSIGPTGANTVGWRLESIFSQVGFVNKIDITLFCRAKNITAGSTGLSMYFYSSINNSYLFADSFSTFNCPYAVDGSGNPYFFPVQIIYQTVPLNSVVTTAMLSNSEIRLAVSNYVIPGGINSLIQIAYVNMTVQIQSSGGNSCASSYLGLPDLGCVLSQSFGPILKALQLVLNIILYIGGWIIWGVTNIANYFSVILWLYSIPGMPSVIQTYISAVLTIWFIVIGLEVYRAIDPFGG